MASVVQSAGSFDASGTATSKVTTFGSSVTTGSTLLAFFNIYNGTNPSVTSVTDTQGNTWSFIVRRRRSTDVAWEVEVWKCENATGGSSFAITGNFSVAVFCGMAILEVDGAAVTDNTSSEDTMGTNVLVATGAAMAATGAGLHLASDGHSAGVGTTMTAQSGWTDVIRVNEDNSGGTVVIESRTAAAAVSQTPEWTTNRSSPVVGLTLHLVVANSAAASLTWMPSYQAAGAAVAGVVASGMTPRGSGT